MRFGTLLTNWCDRTRQRCGLGYVSAQPPPISVVLPTPRSEFADDVSILIRNKVDNTEVANLQNRWRRVS